MKENNTSVLPPSTPPPSPTTSSRSTHPTCPPPPTSYSPSGQAYIFTNFGLPVSTDHHHEYYELTEGITFYPHTPTDLILSMNNINLIKVGLEPSDVIALNSVMFDMHRALPQQLQSIELDYLTHNSLLFLQMTDETNVRLLQGDYIYFAPTAVVQRWRTRSMNALSLKVSIDGLKRCCGRFKLILRVKTMMVEDDEYEDERTIAIL